MRFLTDVSLRKESKSWSPLWGMYIARSHQEMCQVVRSQEVEPSSHGIRMNSVSKDLALNETVELMQDARRSFVFMYLSPTIHALYGAGDRP